MLELYYACVCMYLCACACVCIYIYIYIWDTRELVDSQICTRFVLALYYMYVCMHASVEPRERERVAHTHKILAISLCLETHTIMHFT
jgi:hypothetical protein